MFLKVSKTDKWQCIAKTVKSYNLTFDPNFIEKVPYFTLTTCLTGLCTFCAFH